MNDQKNDVSGSHAIETVLAPVDLTIATTKMLAIGRWTQKGLDKQARLPIMYQEVPATVRLYLSGKIEMWYVKPDLSGAVFIMNVTDPAEAHALLEKLPLGQAKMMEFDLIPLGPISPLRFLLQDAAAA